MDDPYPERTATNAGGTREQTKSPAAVVPEVEEAVDRWRGIKNVLHPILHETNPVPLWESAHPKIWSLYESAGFPFGATEEGFWRWLVEQNRIVATFRPPEENRHWDEGLTHLQERLCVSRGQKGSPNPGA